MLLCNRWIIVRIIRSGNHDIVAKRGIKMKIITLNREYGAGGHSIGDVVAKELGIELYDRDIIRKTAAEMDMDYAQIEKSEEEISRGESIIRRITPISYEQKDYLYEVQKKVILDLAKNGPCVILGRCGDVIMKEAGIPSLDVFLYADEAHRKAWVRKQLNSSNDSEVTKYMHRQERARKAYYEVYTGKQFGDRHNYDLMLDSGSLGYDICAKLIIALAKAE